MGRVVVGDKYGGPTKVGLSKPCDSVTKVAPASDFTSPSFSSYKAGFAGTQHDTVTILSVNGDTVTAHLAAQQTDGTVKNFEGTYVVHNGIIDHFSVHPV